MEKKAGECLFWRVPIPRLLPKALADLSLDNYTLISTFGQLQNQVN